MRIGNSPYIVYSDPNGAKGLSNMINGPPFNSMNFSIFITSARVYFNERQEHSKNFN